MIIPAFADGLLCFFLLLPSVLWSLTGESRWRTTGLVSGDAGSWSGLVTFLLTSLDFWLVYIFICHLLSFSPWGMFCINGLYYCLIFWDVNLLSYNLSPLARDELFSPFVSFIFFSYYSREYLQWCECDLLAVLFLGSTYRWSHADFL